MHHFYALDLNRRTSDRESRWKELGLSDGKDVADESQTEQEVPTPGILMTRLTENMTEMSVNGTENIVKLDEIVDKGEEWENPIGLVIEELAEEDKLLVEDSSKHTKKLGDVEGTILLDKPANMGQSSSELTDSIENSAIFKTPEQTSPASSSSEQIEEEFYDSMQILADNEESAKTSQNNSVEQSVQEQEEYFDATSGEIDNKTDSA